MYTLRNKFLYVILLGIIVSYLNPHLIAHTDDRALERRYNTSQVSRDINHITQCLVATIGFLLRGDRYKIEMARKIYFL